MQSLQSDGHGELFVVNLKYLPHAPLTQQAHNPEPAGDELPRVKYLRVPGGAD
jgi:hypothetical protein